MAYQSEIEKLEKQYLANPDQYFAPFADVNRKAGNLDLALDVVRTGLQKRPNYLSAHIVLGRCLLDQKNDPEAEKVFEHVLSLDTENVIALRYLGEITERSGDTAGARRWLKRLLDADPSNDDAAEALKRLEAAAPAAPPPPPAPEASPESAGSPMRGFESTSMEASTPESAPPPELEPAPSFAPASSSEFSIEQSSSPYEAPHADGAGIAALELETGDISLSEDAPRGVTLDMGPSVEPKVVNFDDPATTQPMAAMPDAPDSVEPPMLMFDEASPVVAQPEPRHTEPPVGLREPAAAPERRSPRGSVSSMGPASDLPLIMPDDLDPVPPPPRSSRSVPVPAVESAEPEPVITETMAEVYLKQGLIAEARQVYEKLVRSRPGDAALRARLAALEPQRGASSVGQSSQPRYAAAETGGVSARSLFGRVLSARPGAPQAPPTPPPLPPPPPPAPLASSGSAMDAAFEDEPVQAPGAPTRATSDELSLAAVFGEEPMPAPRPKAGARPPAPEAGAGGFSFDEFFGAKPGTEAAPPAGGEAPAAEPEGGTPDDFVSWLKGLKS